MWDADSEVYPFLDLHMRVNGVEIRFLNECLEDLTSDHLRGVDVVIGADVCFWHRLVGPVKRLITLALAGDVRLVILADPGRPTFNEVGDYCEERHCGNQFYWRTDRPLPQPGSDHRNRRTERGSVSVSLYGTFPPRSRLVTHLGLSGLRPGLHRHWSTSQV